MIIVCPRCGANNRIPEVSEPSAKYRCGKCRAQIGGPVQASNAGRQTATAAWHRHLLSRPFLPPLIVTALAILFFIVSLWNLGDFHLPSSNWTPVRNPDDIYLDLGTETQVDTVLLFIQDASPVEVDVYSGRPGSWDFVSHLPESNTGGYGVYRQWKEVPVGHETQYVRLTFWGQSGHIGEVALFAGKQRLDIAQVLGNNGEPAGGPLVDEQYLVHEPVSPKSGAYFDEIYFVRTADEYLHLQEPSEWSHPPMSKLIIAASIGVLGNNPFAWRIPGVIFATLMIPLVYLFAKRMFGSPRAGILAAFLLTFDFMHFTLARVGTGETFLVFFIMAMFFFFYRYYQEPSTRGRDLFLSLVCFGFAFSTKWTAMLGFVGLLVLLIMVKWGKPVLRSELLYLAGGLVAAAAIYLLSFIPYFMAGHGLADFWSYQLRMFSFHSGIETGHPCSSPWWSWPFMFRPVTLYSGKFGDTSSYIISAGNPALWWVGTIAVLLTCWLAVRRRDKNAAFVAVPFLAQWLLFIPIPRLFLYHFYPNVLFLVLAATLWLDRLWAQHKWAIASYLAVNVVLFVVFYPVISGLPMTQGYWSFLRSLLGR